MGQEPSHSQEPKSLPGASSHCLVTALHTVCVAATLALAATPCYPGSLGVGLIKIRSVQLAIHPAASVCPEPRIALFHGLRIQAPVQ